MQKAIIPVALVMLAFTACEKTAVVPPQPATHTVVHSAARQIVDFNYTLTKNSDGDYDCPAPKTDCSKIEPDPTLSLQPLDDAISQDKVREFFNSSQWKETFPYLDDQPDVVSGLQGGSYTMVRRTNSSGEIFYIVIPSSADPDNFSVDESIYTTMVTSS